MPIVSAIQMTSTDNVTTNLAMAEKLIAQAAQQGAQLVVLPEMFAVMGEAKNKIAVKEMFGVGTIQDFLAAQAKRHRLILIGGTIPLVSKADDRVHATCLIYNPMGEIIGRYDKIHLFDVNILDQESHHESATIMAGEKPLVLDTVVGKLGLAVCYDIRFPELFRWLFNHGAEILAVPAAFTVPTGEAHWEVLLRARAIESFSYVIAAAQTGTHPNNRKTYGHSMIIDPWGKILAQLNEEVGVISANIDLHYLTEIRKKIPVMEHQRRFS